ncbi:MAG: hypothetical protein KJZ76_18130, partial [Burkholderiaceae bacterium]|nr:hypothetical protein [Burkholderiaceae bacterium]
MVADESIGWLSLLIEQYWGLTRFASSARHGLPISERRSVVFMARREVDVLDGAFVLVDVTGSRSQIPPWHGRHALQDAHSS